MSTINSENAGKRETWSDSTEREHSDWRAGYRCPSPPGLRVFSVHHFDAEGKQKGITRVTKHNQNTHSNGCWWRHSTEILQWDTREEPARYLSNNNNAYCVVCLRLWPSNLRKTELVWMPISSVIAGIFILLPLLQCGFPPHRSAVCWSAHF